MLRRSDSARKRKKKERIAVCSGIDDPAERRGRTVTRDAVGNAIEQRLRHPRGTLPPEIGGARPDGGRPHLRFTLPSDDVPFGTQ